MSDHLIAIMVLTGGVLGMVGFVVSLICVAMVAGFLRSTHTVQYMPVDNKVEDLNPPDVAAENERLLLEKVGRKQKDKPTVVEDLDSPIEEITQTDLKF